MTERICGILVPRKEWDMHVGNDGGECLRSSSHTDGKHVLRNANGEYITWEDDPSCGCCEPGEDEHCFFYKKISQAQALRLITRRD
jgi:hypothetical protein